MNVRPATILDVPLVLPMIVKQYALHTAWDAAKFAPADDLPMTYGHWLAQRLADPTSVFLVADRSEDADQHQPVGFILATKEQEIPIYKTKHYGFIHDLWVDDGYRHEGLGKQLAIRCLEELKARGIYQIRLDTAHPNEAARKLFGSLGFRPVCVQMLMEL